MSERTNRKNERAISQDTPINQQDISTVIRLHDRLKTYLSDQETKSKKESKNSLSIDFFQKEIGPASTPLINEIDSEVEDQVNHEIKLDKLIHRTKSLSSNSDDPSLKNEKVKSQTQDDQIYQANQQVYYSLLIGLTMLIFSSLLWIIGIPLLLFDFNDLIYKLEISQNQHETFLKFLLIKILDDQHYKYLIPLQLTSGLIFVIINWGGLKIFRHS